MQATTAPATRRPIHRLAARLLRWLDPVFAVTLTAALAMVMLTAWPGLAQGAETVSEARSVGSFDAVQTLGPTVKVRQGASAGVTVAAERDLLPRLETVVEDTRLGKTLVVRWKRGHATVNFWTKGSEPVVTITTPRLTGLLVSGSGDIQADGLSVPALSAQVEGSGDIRLTGLATDALTLAVAGSGDISASGRSARLQVSVAGSGDIRADSLAADTVDVSIAGSGDVKVQADKTLAVNIAGSGDVVYSGNAVVRKSIIGSGAVTRR
ncbi:head GIN domain-containing protein [Pseudaquabacterium pictum]|uniref:DUF2807 domain-containing protein n=1 Tax=Pseudaquabacterium pictum TaxID=2315236 RepID=A0A480AW58_9BURK|nr:head GIN domain-containing protein [Rubrivivax pictus]GCL65734.1 DUF2807 domain-containing protein [Rubrivivax pictus]